MHFNVQDIVIGSRRKISEILFSGRVQDPEIDLDSCKVNILPTSITGNVC